MSIATWNADPTPEEFWDFVRSHGDRTFAPGDQTIGGNNEERNITLPISTTAAFPSCLASGVFRVPVLAKAVVNGS